MSTQTVLDPFQHEVHEVHLCFHFKIFCSGTPRFKDFVHGFSKITNGLKKGQGSLVGAVCNLQTPSLGYTVHLHNYA